MSSRLDRRIAVRGSLRLTWRFLLLLAAVSVVLVVVDWLLFQRMLLEGCRALSVGADPLTVAEVDAVAARTFWTNVPIVIGIVLLLGGAVAFLLTYQWSSRIRAVVRTVQEVTTTGDFRRRVELDGSAGAAPGIELVNAMLEMGDDMTRRMRESLDNVAHELRTPLTRLRAGAERALTQAADPTVCHGALSDALEESERLLQVVDTLLDIAEAETGVMSLRPADVDVEEVARSVEDLYEYVAEDEGVRLEIQIEESLRVRADRDRLRQVLANLVDNAIKYGGAGGVVRIEGERIRRDERDAGELVRIRVSDRGLGIPPEELPLVWKRLYRSGRSRRSPKKGLGLGLSFVKAIVEAHGGAASVKSEAGAGATFTVELPAA